MKKFLLFVVITFVALFLAILLAINLSDARSSGTFADLPLFEKKEGHIEIEGINYVFNQFGWRVDQRGERIGYLKSDNGILNQHFYQPFYHGLYEIKDASGVKFYQPHDMFADMEYKLLVPEGINLVYPTLETCGKIETPSEAIITDPAVIKELFHYAVNATSAVNALFPAKEAYTLRIFHNKYSSVYFETTIYKSEKDGTYALENFDRSLNGYIQVPKEFMMKLGIITD
jgi:hypothetical protein